MNTWQINVKRMSNKKSGFTLVEVLIAASIAVIIAGMALMLYNNLDSVFVDGTTSLHLQGLARVAIDWIIKDIKCATQIVASRTIDSQNYTTGNGVLILEVPSIDSSGDIINIDTTYDYIVYSLNDADSTMLDRIVDADASSSRTDWAETLISSVESLVFTSGGTGLSSIADVTTLTNINIALDISKDVVGGRTLRSSLDSRGELRNKQ